MIYLRINDQERSKAFAEYIQTVFTNAVLDESSVNPHSVTYSRDDIVFHIHFNQDITPLELLSRSISKPYMQVFLSETSKGPMTIIGQQVQGVNFNARDGFERRLGLLQNIYELGNYELHSERLAELRNSESEA